MHFSKLNRGELIAVIGGIVLGASLFITWYTTGNANSKLGTFKGADLQLSAWDALTIMRYFLLAGAVAPIILAYVILRDHALSWPRGELTAVVAIYTIGLVVIRGLLVKPGTPSAEIHLGIGWYFALVGGILMLVGALARTTETGGRARKPPGIP